MFRRKMFWMALIVLALAAGGGYYYYDTAYQPAQAAEEEPAVQTATVRRGNLVVSASGTGTVIPSAEINLGFNSGGLLTELPVRVGDRVSAGDELARIDDFDARQAVANAESQVSKAKLDLSTAQQALDDLQAGASDVDIITAKAALATAQEAYQSLVNGPDENEVRQAELSLSRAKNSLWSSQSGRDSACGQSNSSSQCVGAQVSVLNGEIAVEQAQMALDELHASPSAAEVAEARAKVAQAQADLDDLQAGPSEEEIAAAEAKVEQAQLSLTQAQLDLEAAQKDLEQTVLTAPADGTVMEITAQTGERVGTTAIITLADLSRPELEIFLDETDLDKIEVGYDVDVTFDALPDQTFTGQVVQVDPSLYSSGGVSAIRALVQLDQASFSKPQGLPVGLNAAVDVIGGRAENAVLVPVEALREIATGKYAVFVMENGEPKLRSVEVGLMDFTSAEIKSGLEPGEVVTTGIVETQ